MKKLYIISAPNNGEGVYNLVADDGEGLASHFCSHAGYAFQDLIGRPERQKKYKERFGEYEVIWLDDDDMTLTKLMQLNSEWSKKQPPKRVAPASVVASLGK